MEAVVVGGEQLEVEGGRQQFQFASRQACPRVCRRQQPAEVRVPGSGLDEQRHVCATAQRYLRAGDRPHAEEPRRVRELERAVDPVVVGERERLVAQLGGPRGELLRPRGTVEERIG